MSKMGIIREEWNDALLKRAACQLQEMYEIYNPRNMKKKKWPTLAEVLEKHGIKAETNLMNDLYVWRKRRFLTSKPTE